MEALQGETACFPTPFMSKRTEMSQSNQVISTAEPRHSHACTLQDLPLFRPFYWSRTYRQGTLPEVTSWSWKSHNRYIHYRLLNVVIWLGIKRWDSVKRPVTVMGVPDLTLFNQIPNLKYCKNRLIVLINHTVVTCLQASWRDWETNYIGSWPRSSYKHPQWFRMHWQS